MIFENLDLQIKEDTVLIWDFSSVSLQNKQYFEKKLMVIPHHTLIFSLFPFVELTEINSEYVQKNQIEYLHEESVRDFYTSDYFKELLAKYTHFIVVTSNKYFAPLISKILRYKKSLHLIVSTNYQRNLMMFIPLKAEKLKINIFYGKDKKRKRHCIQNEPKLEPLPNLENYIPCQVCQSLHYIDPEYKFFGNALFRLESGINFRKKVCRNCVKLFKKRHQREERTPQAYYKFAIEFHKEIKFYKFYDIEKFIGQKPIVEDIVKFNNYIDLSQFYKKGTKC